MSGKVRRFFPGGNTSRGFYSYYDYIIEKDAHRIFIIKGGPGVGKSSMMKEIAQEMLERGYDVEYHHCSSDDQSVDGIVIIDLNIAIIDGTSPHIIDPRNPGVVDEIINLGDYWDVEKILSHKVEIIKTNQKVGKLFNRAYKYFASARSIYGDIEERYSEAMDFGRVNELTHKCIKEIFKKVSVSKTAGKARHLFGSAYTPRGWIDFTEHILTDTKKVYYIKGDHGTGKSTFLKRIYNEAIERGLYVEVFHAPLIPEKIETVYIKSLNVGLTISDQFKDKNQQVYNLNNYLNTTEIEKYDILLNEDRKIMNLLIDTGLDNIKKAKELHDVLEGYYIANMNFTEINKVKENIISRCLQMI
ncbi:MAG: PRK06851 family protein [Peptostreptococcales bacterium]|jgi:nucleoside-triphosphatase THEP1